MLLMRDMPKNAGKLASKDKGALLEVERYPMAAARGRVLDALLLSAERRCPRPAEEMPGLRSDGRWVIFTSYLTVLVCLPRKQCCCTLCNGAWESSGAAHGAPVHRSD